MPNSTLCVKSQRNCKGLHLNLLFIVAGAFLLNDCYNDVFEFLLQYNSVLHLIWHKIVIFAPA